MDSKASNFRHKIAVENLVKFKIRFITALTNHILFIEPTMFRIDVSFVNVRAVTD